MQRDFNIFKVSMLLLLLLQAVVTVNGFKNCESIEDEITCLSYSGCKWSYGRCSQQIADRCGINYDLHKCADSYSQSVGSCSWQQGNSTNSCADQCQFLTKFTCENPYLGNGCSSLCKWNSNYSSCERNLEFTIPKYNLLDNYPCGFDKCSLPYNGQCSYYPALSDYCGFYYTRDMCSQVANTVGCEWVGDGVDQESLFCADRCYFQSDFVTVINNCARTCLRGGQSRIPREDTFIISDGKSCQSDNCVALYSKSCRGSQIRMTKNQ